MLISLLQSRTPCYLLVYGMAVVLQSTRQQPLRLLARLAVEEQLRELLGDAPNSCLQQTSVSGHFGSFLPGKSCAT
jgi:hypothetical protein